MLYEVITPLGFLGMLFTPAAIVIGGTVLCTPIVAHYSMVASRGADRRIFPTAITLGAGPGRAAMKFVSEIRFGVITSYSIHYTKLYELPDGIPP